MKQTVQMLVIGSLSILLLMACGGTERIYQHSIELHKGIEFRPRKLATGGNVSDHPCLRGSYAHTYETDQGNYGQREVWLCCVPVEEILSDSFNCGGSVFPSLPVARVFGGDSDYWKIRSCHLLHPTETDPTFIPVCIPAPLHYESPGETAHW